MDPSNTVSLWPMPSFSIGEKRPAEMELQSSSKLLKALPPPFFATLRLANLENSSRKIKEITQSLENEEEENKILALEKVETQRDLKIKIFRAVGNLLALGKKGCPISHGYATEVLGPSYFHPQNPKHYHPYKIYSHTEDESSLDNIQTLFQEWKESSSQLSYKNWLKVQPDAFMDDKGVNYLDEKKLESYEIVVKNGVVKKTGTQDIYFTRDEETRYWGYGAAMFVLSLEGKLYSSSQVAGRFHHSSFLSGKPVKAAGEWRINKKGKIREVSNKSGHYWPSVKENLAILQFLKDRGVDLTAVKFAQVNASGLEIVYNAEEYLQQCSEENGQWKNAASPIGFFDLMLVTFPERIKFQGKIFDLVSTYQKTLSDFGMTPQNMVLLDHIKTLSLDSVKFLLNSDDVDVGLEEDDLKKYEQTFDFLDLKEPQKLMVLKKTPFGFICLPEETYYYKSSFWFLSENFLFIKNGKKTLVLLDKGNVSDQQMAERCHEFFEWMLDFAFANFMCDEIDASDEEFEREKLDRDQIEFIDSSKRMNGKEFSEKYITPFLSCDEDSSDMMDSD